MIHYLLSCRPPALVLMPYTAERTGKKKRLLHGYSSLIIKEVEGIFKKYLAFFKNICMAR